MGVMSKIGTAALAAAGGFVLLLFGARTAEIAGKTPEQIAAMDASIEAASERSAAERRAKHHPELAMRVSASRHVDSLGADAFVTLDGRITSDAQVRVKDPVISCDLNGPSGTTVATVQATLFQEIEPKQDTLFEKLDFGVADPQWEYASCRVSKVAQLS